MYTENRFEMNMLAATGESVVDLTSTGDKAIWEPANVSYIVRQMAVVLNATPGDAGVLKFDLRPTRASDTNRTDGTVGTINLATTHTFTAGSVQPVVYHRPTAPITVYPGQEIVAEMTDASAGVTAARIILWLEGIYQTPNNMANLSTSTVMVATT